jgi:hypothetical protein
MAQGKLQMSTLSNKLKPSVKKKTQGKVVPVSTRVTPYKSPVGARRAIKPPGGPASPSTNALGALAQQQGLESRQPVSTKLDISYEADPVLARIKALGTQDVANARSEAEALRKKAIIDSGLSDVGAEIGVDPNTVQAAAANPFSTAALLRKEQEVRGRDLDNSLNQQNLFYSGYRANQLTDLATSGAQQQSQLQGDVRSLLGGINTGVTEAEQAAFRAEQAAMEQAAEEARMAALQQAYLDAIAAANAPVDVPAMAPAVPAGTSPYDAGVSPINGAPLDPVLGQMPNGTNDADIIAALGMAGVDQQYLPSYAAAPTPYSALNYEPQQFIPESVAQAAQVNPYFYDPYEAAVPSRPEENPIYSMLGYA